MTQQELLSLAEEVGFSHAGELNRAALEFLPQVREMCAADRCHNYGRCWTCPPACGTLEEAARRAGRYRRGVLLQSTGTLEDDFDVETMQETERLQRERFAVFVERVRRRTRLPAHGAPAAAASARRVPARTHPAVFQTGPSPPWRPTASGCPCVCERSGLPYYYGAGTITYYLPACLCDAAQ